MSIYISFHPLDYDFAYELLVYIRNLGLEANLCAPMSQVDFAQKITREDKLIGILRPEYVQSVSYSMVVNLAEIVSEFFPVLRFPISVDEWSANRLFRPVADFTDRDSDSIKRNLILLRTALLANANETNVISTKEIYLNNLSIAIQSYIRPISLLEHINYASDHVNDLPLIQCLDAIRFKVGTLNKQVEYWGDYQWSRKGTLEDITKYYKSFTLICNNLDYSAIAYYLVDAARRRSKAEAAAPTPILLDMEYWPHDVPWIVWLQNQITFSSTVIEDISNGKCSIYLLGMDSSSFSSHPLKGTFVEWLYGTSAPRYFVAISTNLSNINDSVLLNTIVVPSDGDISEYRELCLQYPDRPFCQFVIRSSENASHTAIVNYLLQRPVLSVILLSVIYEANVDFEALGVGEYFELLIKNLWQIEMRRYHDNIIDYLEIEDCLVKFAALATEQQRINLTYQGVISQFPSQLALATCIDAGILSMSKHMICFSMPIIHEYFAAKALMKYGLQTRLPKLTIDKRFHRIPQRWDKPIITFSHLSDNKDEILEHIGYFDPLLSLDCIANGLPVSAPVYSNIIEQNLISLTTLGDFRTEFARLMYRIDPKASRLIFIEILRDARWEIRLNAFFVFIELEKSFLPGLAEAIAQITDSTRMQVIQATRRLGIEALPTLYALLRRDDVQYRLNAAWALGALGDKASVPALIGLLRDNNLAVSKQVIVSLDLLQDINCVPYLVKSFNTHRFSLRKAIVSALVHLYQNLPKEFASSVQDLSPSEKISVIQILHGSPSVNLVDLLIELSFDDDVDVRLTAIKELGSYSETRVISRLEECIDDMSKSKTNKYAISEIVTKILSNIQQSEHKEEKLIIQDNNNDEISNSKSVTSSEIVKARLLLAKAERVKALNPIGKTPTVLPVKTSAPSMGSETTTSPVTEDSYVFAVLEQLRERKWTSSSNAARTLREYIRALHGTANLNVINQILETLNDADWVIRWTGVETLGWTGNVNVVPHLVQRLSDNNWKVRIAAIRSLSEIGDNTAVAGLSALLSDNNSVVREAAAEALGILNGQDALQALESAAIDQEDFVRLAVIESLGRFQQKSAAKILLTALKDKSEHVRWAAANGLSNIASADMVSYLIPSLLDTAGPYWEQKRICDVIVDILKQIGSDEALNAIESWGHSQV